MIFKLEDLSHITSDFRAVKLSMEPKNTLVKDKIATRKVVSVRTSVIQSTVQHLTVNRIPTIFGWVANRNLFEPPGAPHLDFEMWVRRMSSAK
jgi:hypothetical protein